MQTPKKQHINQTFVHVYKTYPKIWIRGAIVNKEILNYNQQRKPQISNSSTEI